MEEGVLVYTIPKDKIFARETQKICIKSNQKYIMRYTLRKLRYYKSMIYDGLVSLCDFVPTLS